MRSYRDGVLKHVTMEERTDKDDVLLYVLLMKLDIWVTPASVMLNRR